MFSVPPEQPFQRKGYPGLERLSGSLRGLPVALSRAHWPNVGKEVGILKDYNGNWHAWGTQILVNEGINKILTTPLRFYISFFSLSISSLLFFLSVFRF